MNLDYTCSNYYISSTVNKYAKLLNFYYFVQPLIEDYYWPSIHALIKKLRRNSALIKDVKYFTVIMIISHQDFTLWLHARSRTENYFLIRCQKFVKNGIKYIEPYIISSIFQAGRELLCKLSLVKKCWYALLYKMVSCFLKFLANELVKKVLFVYMESSYKMKPLSLFPESWLGRKDWKEMDGFLTMGQTGGTRYLWDKKLFPKSFGVIKQGLFAPSITFSRQYSHRPGQVDMYRQKQDFSCVDKVDRHCKKKVTKFLDFEKACCVLFLCLALKLWIEFKGMHNWTRSK